MLHMFARSCNDMLMCIEDVTSMLCGRKFCQRSVLQKNKEWEVQLSKLCDWFYSAYCVVCDEQPEGVQFYRGIYYRWILEET